jgi:hypothetical protein
MGLGPAHYLEVEVFGERCSGNNNVTTGYPSIQQCSCGLSL